MAGRGLGPELSWYFNLFFGGALLGSRLRWRHPWLPLLGLLLVALTPWMGGVFGAALLLGLGVAVANFYCNALLQLYKG